MKRPARQLRSLQLVAIVALATLMAGCGTGSTSSQPNSIEPDETEPSQSAAPDLDPRTILIDTDVAPDDLVALAFLLSAPHVTVAAITVSGTGEAHCAGGVDVVLRLLELLDAPDIPVACGRETPLEGDHAFPNAWREGADQGSGLNLPSTEREPATLSAIELIQTLATEHEHLEILTLGPLTNLAEAVVSDPALASRLGPVFVMGGAIHVPGNIGGPGAPEGNTVAEWNIYVDPHAAQVVVESGLNPSFVSLDGTSLVPVTVEFGRQAKERASTAAGDLLAGLFAANPFMTDGSYFLWDPLAAELAAGYPVGSFSPATIVVEEAEGPESGFTRPTSGSPNALFLSTADPLSAETTLLGVLNGG